MNSIETVLLENIENPASLFIFPTDIAASGWADRLLRIKGGSVAMNKFTAWDKFKQNSIKSKVKNKKSIPSALRKIFISRLIRENADSCSHEAQLRGENPIFSSLIKTQWAAEADRFTPWLAEILPQLGTWFYKITGLAIDNILSEEAQKATSGLEGDEKDMFVLALRYAQFLAARGLFEPAWETPPFNNDGKECFIFFPESLSDFGEYSELLAASSHVRIISAQGAEDLPCDAFYYTNSRSEITEAALYIRALNEKQNIAWDSIAVCISDPESYEPYVLREFTNRNIPFVKRTSKPLTDFPAGRFFRSVLDCTTGDFSFSSIVSLIMNKNLPWKETELIDKLVKFGIENNCLYSWDEEKEGKLHHINVWEDAFNSPYEYIDAKTKKFFFELKKRLFTLRSAGSFSELLKAYFIFREYFLDMENCSTETDLILSRCISELLELAELEKDFPDVNAVDPFLFLTEYLSEVNYLAQSSTSGVAILPYKTAAAAPYDCHIILGAGHDNLSVVYSKLNFLPVKKRKILGLTDEDASSAFINMHKFNSAKISAFFCGEQSFSGYAIPHSKTGSPSKPKERYSTIAEFSGKFAEDLYGTESRFITEASPEAAIDTLHENQKNGFIEWKNRRKNTVLQKNRNLPEKTIEYIHSIYVKNNKTAVSASSMQTYFQCSLKWLFERVFALTNVQIETSLMEGNISGSVYHAIFDRFFKELAKQNKPLLEPVQQENDLSLPSNYGDLLQNTVDEVFDYFPALELNGNPQMSALTKRLLYAAKKDYLYNLEKLLTSFLSLFAGCRVAGSEMYFEAERESLILRGFVDCILKDKNNNLIIVDFKLKHLPERNDCTMNENELTNFQLPMYITLTEENEKYKVYTALFYSIIDCKSEVIFGTAYDSSTEKTLPKKEEDKIIHDSERYKLIFEEFNRKTKQFAREVSSGNFTVFEQQNSNCRDCAYHRICRTVYVINREYNSSMGKHQ